MFGSQALPYQTDFAKNAFRHQLLDPDDAAMQGPCAAAREPSVIVGGLLAGWHSEAVKQLKKPQKPLEGWDQVVWDENDDQFIENLTECTSPEQVESAMPAKWLPHARGSEVDERLARICTLCTVLVNKYVAYENGGATAPQTTAQWREHQRLKDVMGEVLRVLEASVGETIAPRTLRDAKFLRDCWAALSEEDRRALENLLDIGAPAAATNNHRAAPTYATR
jgi:hypothetical protein